MFSGIVQSVGTLRAVETFGHGDLRMQLEAPKIQGRLLRPGSSLCVSGVCLTIIAEERGRVSVDVSARTLADTSIGDWRAGRKVNLEPALTAGAALGGHFVMGHVDGVAEVKDCRPDGRSTALELAAAADWMKFVAPKGSVALDGVSLTVNEVAGQRFTLNLVPYTLQETTLADCRIGSRLNLEVDIIARYAARLLAGKLPQSAP